jgi:hypothetical protein
MFGASNIIYTLRILRDTYVSFDFFFLRIERHVRPEWTEECLLFITNGVSTAMDCDLRIFHKVTHLENLYAESLKMMNVVSVA